MGVGRFVIVSWRRSLLLLWLSGTLALVKKKIAPAEHKGDGLGVRTSSLHCGFHDAPWTPSLLMGGGKNGVSQLSCPWRGEFNSIAVQEALHKTVNNISSFVPGIFRSLSLPCLYLCHLLTWQHKTPVIYLRCARWVSNSKIWRLGMARTHADPLGENLTVLGLMPVCHRRTVERTHRGLEFIVNHSKILASRLSVLSSCLCSFCWWTGQLSASCWLFCPHRGRAPSLKWTLRKGTGFPSLAQGIF